MAYPILSAERLYLSYPGQTEPAVQGVSFVLEEGNILALLGPSGCGKTSLLRIIAGFEQCQSGVILIRNQPVAAPGILVPPEKRHIGIVFQDYALFPHLDVFHNVGFGVQKHSSPDREQAIHGALAQVGLQNFASQYPHQLSGGQQQRVALARALITKPALVLLDEPLSNIDSQLRLSLRQELREILQASHTSAIWVTHDQEEAMAVADWIGVMRGGQLEQWGKPEEVYRYPQTRFVASFVTQANFLPIVLDGTTLSTEIGTFSLQGIDPADLTGKQLMVRQEDFLFSPRATGEVVIADRVFLGREWLYHLRTRSGLVLQARVTSQTPSLPIGCAVAVSVRDDNWQLIG